MTGHKNVCLWMAIIMVVTAGCAKRAMVEEEEIDFTIDAGDVVSPLPEEEGLLEEVEPPTLVLGTIRFDFDKYDIRPREAETLRENARQLKLWPDAQVLIEGHCDERGTDEYNLALGDRRAKAAKDYLVRLGIDSNRLETISYGEQRPIDYRHNEDAWAVNRRATFIILSQ